MRPAIWMVATLTLGACGSVETSINKPNEPTIAMVMPDHGPTPGGATITLVGKHFKSNSTPIVVVGRNAATNVVATSDTQLTFTLPPGDQEGAVVDVTVSTADGFATDAQSFTYNLLPVVISVSPTIGKGAGGTEITVTGRGFMTDDSGTAQVQIDGTMATNVQVVSDTMLTATTAPAAAGTKAFSPLDVDVVNSNGDAKLSGGFEITKQGLIAIERCCSQRIFYVDTMTGDVEQISTTGRFTHGCAVSPSGGVFAMTRDLTTGNFELATLDPLTGDVNPVGPTTDATPTNHNISALEFVNGTLYGIDSRSANRLLSINTSTGAAALLGSTAMGVGRDSAIAFKDAATVYVADFTNQTLDTIAVATSVLTTGVALSGGTSQRVHGLVATGGALYLSESSTPSIVYTVNTTSGVLSRLASIPATISGMCKTPPSF